MLKQVFLQPTKLINCHHGFHNPSGSSIWVENIIEALNEPGEWVVNTKTKKIYLWPANPSSDGKPQGILAPTTSELIRVEGQIDYAGSNR